jgi:hypothetical protein
MTTDACQPLPDFDAWWDYDQPAATEQRFRELLPQADTSGSAEAANETARLERLKRLGAVS